MQSVKWRPCHSDASSQPLMSEPTMSAHAHPIMTCICTIVIIIIIAIAKAHDLCIHPAKTITCFSNLACYLLSTFLCPNGSNMTIASYSLEYTWVYASLNKWFIVNKFLGYYYMEREVRCA